MKIPKFKPLWNLSGKIAYWYVDHCDGIGKKAGLVFSALAMMALSIVTTTNPTLFNGLFSVHTVKADYNNNLHLAQYSGDINTKASSINNYYYAIPTFTMDIVPLIGGYFINSDLTGSAIVDINGRNIPYMPPSGDDTVNWYFFTSPVQQSKTYNYKLYTGAQDLNGDIVYFPSSSGMRVNGDADLDFGTDDFTIRINGYFDSNNTGADSIIFQNDEFMLQYRNGQLVLSNGSSGIISTQVSTVEGYTLKNGTFSTVLNNTSNAIVTLVANPVFTQTTTTGANTITVTSSSSDHSTTYRDEFNTEYGTVITTWHTTIWSTINTTRTTAKTTSNVYTAIDGLVPVIFGDYTTTLSGNDVTTLILNDQSGSAKTISMGAPITTKTPPMVTTTASNTTTAKTTSVTSRDNAVYPYTRTTRWTTYFTTNYTDITRATTYDIWTQIQNAGKVADRIGIMYYDIPSNTYTADWNGGDKTLIIARSGSVLTISDGSTTLMSVPIGSDPVETDAAQNWTFAQQGAMKYLRNLEITKQGATVGSWAWNKGATFTDLSGNGNTAYPSFRSSPINNNTQTVFGNYRAISTRTTTTTTSATGTEASSTGLIDTETPDSEINRPRDDDSNWQNIFLFGIFYNIAQEGGIPPSLFFVPLFGCIAILAFFVAYHFTRDMLISGIVGNAVLGFGVTVSILYTIPLVLGIVLMFVMLVKRKTVSL